MFNLIGHFNRNEFLHLSHGRNTIVAHWRKSTIMRRKSVNRRSTLADLKPQLSTADPENPPTAPTRSRIFSMDAGNQILQNRRGSFVPSSRGSSISETVTPHPILKKMREKRARPRVSFLVGDKDPVGTGYDFILTRKTKASANSQHFLEWFRIAKRQ